MFRIVTKVAFKSSPFATPTRAKGVFGSPKAVHGFLRRFKKFESAVEKACSLPGEHEIMDDTRRICAFVKGGEVKALAPGYRWQMSQKALRELAELMSKYAG